LNRKDAALSALLAANSKPPVKVKSIDSPASTSGYCGTLGPESLSRVRDREAEAESAPEPVLSEYEADVKAWGVQWATVYQREREATSKAQRIAAEKLKVELAHKASEQRDAEAREAQRLAEQKRREDITRTLLENEDRRAVRLMLDKEPFGIVEKVLHLARGSTQPFIIAALLEEEKRHGKY